MDPSSSPGLLRLSPELRNIIYEHALANRYAVTLQAGVVQHSLTKVCRQIRRETLHMYFSRTRFNAHLDDGPVVPLANLLRALDPELVLATEEINIWDLHMLNASLHGETSTERFLESKPEEGDMYVLRSVELAGSLGAGDGDTPYLRDLIGALCPSGLALRRLCVVGSGGDVIKDTSKFAIVRQEVQPIVARVTQSD